MKYFIIYGEKVGEKKNESVSVNVFLNVVYIMCKKEEKRQGDK